MGLFQEIEGEAAVLVENGVYKQVPIFKRNGYLYAKTNGGFVKLFADGSTTKPKCRLETLTWDNPEQLGRDSLGKLCIADEIAGKATKVTPLGNSNKLLGAPD